MPDESKQPEASPDDLASLWGAPPSVNPQPKEKDKSSDVVEEAELVERPVPSTKTEAATPPAETHQEEDLLPEEDSIAEKVRAFLSEVNIDAKQIIITIVVLLLVVSGFYFGVRFLWGFLTKDKAPSKNSQTESVYSGLTSSVELGKRLSLPESFFTSQDVNLSVLIGQGKLRKSRINDAILLLKRMQNSYATDIQALLSASRDRRRVLKNHIARLKDLDAEAIDTAARLKDEIARYQPIVNDTQTQQTELERNFFDQIKAYNPQSEDLLDTFIEKAQQNVAIRARYRGLQQISALYTQALPRFEARMKDIDLNQEALIQGLKVYDVKGSDLNLIEFVDSNVPNTSNGGFLRLLPVFPSTNGNNDFITKGAQPKGNATIIVPAK